LAFGATAMYTLLWKTIAQFFHTATVYVTGNDYSGQYHTLAYTTWRDLNQSQPYISIRGITVKK